MKPSFFSGHPPGIAHDAPLYARIQPRTESVSKVRHRPAPYQWRELHTRLRLIERREPEPNWLQRLLRYLSPFRNAPRVRRFDAR